MAYNVHSDEIPVRDGYVMYECRWTWDKVSVYPNCDGPITRLRVRNTSTGPAWVKVPRKKKGNPWVQIDPGTDIFLTQGQRNQLGLENYQDVVGAEVSETQPVA